MSWVGIGVIVVVAFYLGRRWEWWGQEILGTRQLEGTAKVLRDLLEFLERLEEHDPLDDSFDVRDELLHEYTVDDPLRKLPDHYTVVSLRDARGGGVSALLHSIERWERELATHVSPEAELQAVADRLRALAAGWNKEGYERFAEGPGAEIRLRILKDELGALPPVENHPYVDIADKLKAVRSALNAMEAERYPDRMSALELLRKQLELLDRERDPEKAATLCQVRDKLAALEYVLYSAKAGTLRELAKKIKDRLEHAKQQLQLPARSRRSYLVWESERRSDHDASKAPNPGVHANARQG